MGFKLDMAEENRATLEIAVGREKYAKSIAAAVKKIGKQVNIPGFRKGKAPRHILERHVGKEYILDEAAQPLIAPAYISTLDEANLDPITPPEVDIVQMEEGQELVFTAKIQLPPEVKLGEYLDLPVNKEIPETSDEQVEEELKRRQEAHARIVVLDADAPAEDGDIVNIDFEGFNNGIPFPGGKGEDYALTLGSGTFIPGFEEQLVGCKTDEDKEVNVTFPEDYNEETLKGCAVVFKVKVNTIKRKELVPLDDEFAKDISEFDTLEELREDIKSNLMKAQTDRFHQESKNEVVKIAVDNAEVDIPDVMINDKYESMIREMLTNLERQGITLAQYCQYFGMEPNDFMADVKNSAEESVRRDLVLDAVARAETIECSEDDFVEELKKFAQAQKCSEEELRQRLQDQGELRGLKKSIARDKTIAFLISKNLPDIENSER